MANDPSMIQALVEEVQQLEAASPILLFPMRVETRFMTIKHVVGAPDTQGIVEATVVPGLSQVYEANLAHLQDQVQKGVATAALLPGWKVSPADPLLTNTEPVFACHPDKKALWIRLFPDEIAIQTHEEALTEDEVLVAKSFWRALHQAEHPPQEIVDNRSPEEVAYYQQNQRIGAWKALLNSYGTARSAWIVQQLKPTNIEAFPTAAPVFGPDPSTKPVSWNEQACTRVMPSRFVAILFDEAGEMVHHVLGNAIPDPLYVGINPQESQENAFVDTGAGLEMPENIKWLTHFPAAEEVGMGLSIELDPTKDNHQFAKLLVLGIREQASAEECQSIIEDLFTNHRFAEGGLSVLGVGTPSNNTQEEATGESLDELSPAESFALFVLEQLPSESTETLHKSDGQRLDEGLGIGQALFRACWGGQGQTISSAMWMNKVLIPGTLGYSLPQFFYPTISGEEVELTLRFMEEQVLGRGKLSSLRVDDQPYGIIPITNSRQFAALTSEGLGGFLPQLNAKVLQELVPEWRALVQAEVKHLTKHLAGAQVSSTLLKILEQHASSVDFFQRLVLDQATLTTLQNITDNAGDTIVSNIGSNKAALQAALAALNFNLPGSLLGLDLFQSTRLADLTGPILDGLPFLEDRSLSPLLASDHNFLQWMAAPETTFSQLLNETPFDGQDSFPPRSLLYLLSRFSLLRQYLHTALRLGIQQEAFVAAVAMDYPRNMVWVQEGQTPQLEPHFQQILDQAAAQVAAAQPGTDAATLAAQFVGSETYGPLFSSNNRWSIMDLPYGGEDSNSSIRTFIDAQLLNGEGAEGADLREQKALLEKLGALSSAQLERLFAEHIDLCHFRLDAWLQGLANFRLAELRQQRPSGTYFGAFAYLEDLQESPQNGIFVKVLSAAEAQVGEEAIAPLLDTQALALTGDQLTDFLQSSFVYLGGQAAGDLAGNTFAPIIDFDVAAGQVLPVPREQLKSQGFIPTPSLSHATTAAILRNAYTSYRQTGAADEAFAIDLSSARTREAMYFLEGIQNGQSIAELLGYKFERALREDPNYAIQLLFEIREQYPFEMQPIGQEVDQLVKSEARHIVNGLDLIQGYRSFADENDFFSQFGVAVSPAQRSVIRTSILALENTLDAIKDLLMAESMYQLAVENPDRSRAALRTLNDMGNVQMPEVVNIPREGIHLTHRAGVQLARIGGVTEWLGARTPRSTIEPRVNRWLREKLPEPSRIAIRVRWVDHLDTEEDPVYAYDKVLLKHLAIQPIDFVYLMHQDRENPLDGELRYRVDQWVRGQNDLSVEQYVELLPRDRTSFATDEVSLFALEPLVLGLADLVINARSIGPEDVILQNDPAIQSVEKEWKADTFQRRVAAIRSILIRPIDALGGKLDRLQMLASLDEAGLTAENPDSLKDFFFALRKDLMTFTSLGWVEALPMRDRRLNPVNIGVFHRQCRTLHQKAVKHLQKIEELLDQADQLPTGNKLEKIELIKEVVRLGLSKSFNTFPEFTIFSKTAYQAAFDYDDLLAYAGDFALEEWMQSLVPVRPRMALYHKVSMLSELLDAPGAEANLQPIQFPFVGDDQDRWLGVPYPAHYDDFDENNDRRLPDDTLSLVFEYPPDFSADRVCAGFIFDEWNEQIPVKETNLGLAMHYDKPNSEPPNALLLAVSPIGQGQWDWEQLLGTVQEAFEWARFRAVDPDAIRKSALSQFLPAIIPPINLKNHVPAVDLGRNMAKATPGDSGIVFKEYALDQVELSPDFDVSELALDDIFDED